MSLSHVSETELRQLEKNISLYPGIVDPAVMTRLIATIRHFRGQLQQVELELRETNRTIISLKDELSLRDERDHWKRSYELAVEDTRQLREEHAHYRARLAQILREVHGQRKKRRR